MEIEKINTKAVSLVETLKAVTKITTPDEYLKCGEMWNAGRDMLKEIDKAYDDIIASAYETHKKAVAKKKSFYLPVEEATKFVKKIMSNYDDEQERIRKEAEAKLQAQAQKQEEEARLNAALEAEKAGQVEAAEKLLESATPPPIIKLEKDTPKIDGMVFRTIWDAEVTDIDRLINAVAKGKVSPNALQPNMVFLRSQARSLKDTMMYPGVRAFKRKV
jgi:hypothetical protein